MPRISILIPDGESPFALHVLACLMQVKDIDIHLISKKASPLTKFSRRIRSFYVLKTGESLLDGVLHVCNQNKIDLCMPVDTEGIYYFSQHREQVEQFVKLSIIESTQTIRKVWDKGLLADFLLSSKLPHPRTFNNKNYFDTYLSELMFPVLIKPRLAGGGQGIKKYEDKPSLLEKIKSTPDFFENFIIQEYIDGEDIDCSVFCKDGKILAYTIQKGLFKDMNSSYQSPEAIEFLHNIEVLNLTSDLKSALRWNGIAHIDLRKRSSDGQLMIIEINPRFWGSIEGSLHAGINFVELAVKAGIGEAFSRPEYLNIKYCSALSTIKRKLKNKPSVNLLFETNLRYYLQDPLPVLARLAGIGH